MPHLTELAGQSLGRGDILRLSENYDLKPGSGPVDLMVFDPQDDAVGLGLIVTSGYKAGLILHEFPVASIHAEGGLSVDWLISNWDNWFRFTYHDDRIPVEDARVLRWDARTLPEEI